MELAGQVEALRERGLGTAALSYDSVAALADFGARRRIPFPLLSDPDSAVIRRFGLLDEEYPPGHGNHGVPHPATFVTDRDGVVRAKYLEEGYVPRRTAAAILIQEGGVIGEGREYRTPFFRARSSASNVRVRPGFRVSLVLELEMAEGFHAYAPGASDYKVLALRLGPHPVVTPHPLVYPASRPYHFAPLDETVPVFEGRFRLLQDVTFAGRKEIAEWLSTAGPTVDLEGELQYQVCSATVCHPPGTLRVSWSLTVEPADADRVPEALRRR